MDGWRTHGTRAAWKYDIERSNVLVALGWRVLRGTWRGLRDHPDVLVGQLRDLLLPTFRI